MHVLSDFVCPFLPRFQLISLACTSNGMLQGAWRCLKVPVRYISIHNEEEILLFVTPFEDLKSVKSMIRTFTQLPINVVWWHAGSAGWWWKPCAIGAWVHSGTRWSSTGLGLLVRAKGAMLMDDANQGFFLLRDGSSVVLVMAYPLADWEEYNCRAGVSQEDLVEVTCFWKDRHIVVVAMEDLP